MTSRDLPVRALLVGSRLDLRALDGRRLSPRAVALEAGGATAIGLRFGAVVLFGVSDGDERALLDRLRPHVGDPVDTPETEEATLRVEPGSAYQVHDGVLVTPAADLQHLEVIADALAKSVALAQHEARIAEVFRRIEPLAQALHASGRPHRRSRELISQVGASLLMEYQLIGRMEVEDKPDISWEHAELDRLNAILVEEYELKERHRTFERKLALVSRTVNTLLELLQNLRALRVEWLIALLIVMEGLLMAYDVFKP